MMRSVAVGEELRKAEDLVKETWSNYILATLGQDARVDPGTPEGHIAGHQAYLHQRLLTAALAHCQARQKLEALLLLEKT
jgi:hypothetical protein